MSGSPSINASKFLHANKSRFLKYHRFVLFDFYSLLVDTLKPNFVTWGGAKISKKITILPRRNKRIN